MTRRYDLDTVTVGQLLDDPEAKAVIDEALPGVTGDPMVVFVRGRRAMDVLTTYGGRVDPAVVTRLRERLASLG